MLTRDPEPLAIEVLDVENDLEHAPAGWSELQSRLPRVPLFLTWEWVSTWWRHFREDRELWLLATRDRSGRIRGLVPLVLGIETHALLRLRRLSFAGQGIAHPAHLDALARPEDSAGTIRALVDFLYRRRREWDVLDLAGLAEDSSLVHTLARGGRRFTAATPVECRYTLLPGRWEDYEARQLSAKLRSNLRAQQRRLERDHPGAVAFHSVVAPHEIDHAVGVLGELHRKRWAGKAGATPLEHRGFAAFFAEFAALALERGWLRFHQLRLDEEIIAVNYCFQHGDVTYGYQKAFDPEWARYGPGQLLQAYAIRRAIEEQAREFDLLQGDQNDKRVWADAARREVRALYCLRSRGDAYVRMLTAYERVKPLAQRALPAGIQTRIERIAFERMA